MVKRKVVADEPYSYFDDRDTFVVSFPSSWKLRAYNFVGFDYGGEIILVKKRKVRG